MGSHIKTCIQQGRTIDSTPPKWKSLKIRDVMKVLIVFAMVCLALASCEDELSERCEDELSDRCEDELSERSLEVLSRMDEVESRLSQDAKESLAASKRSYIAKKYRMQIEFLKDELNKEEARHKTELFDVIDVYMKF